MKIHKTSQSSNTWWLVTTLSIIYFLFRLNLFYSVAIYPPCRAVSDYWLTSGGYFADIYSLFLLIFLLIGGWSIIELVTAIIERKSDKAVAVSVNLVILLFLLYLFYGFSKMWDYFQVQRDIKEYSAIHLKPRADSYEGQELFHDFLVHKHCSGETERLWPSSIEDRDRLYGEFIEAGWVRDLDIE